LLTGSVYRKCLVQSLNRQAFQVEAPLTGMSLGHQLRWLNNQVRDAELHEDQ
jgi:hypothetical protein